MRRVGTAILVIIAAVQIGRLAIFMVDRRHREHSLFPHADTIAEHSCLTAYHTAAELVRDGSGDDVYEPWAYGGKIGAFRRDPYQYPPPFLLLPRALGAISGHDFFRLRAVWFPLCLLPLVAALAALARFTRRGEVAVLEVAVVSATPTLLALQYGNFHVPAVALAVLAMLALRAGDRPGAFPARTILGGAALSFVTLAKIFPGLLIVVLAAERRWRALAFTAAWGAIWVLLCAAVLGPGPLLAFVHDHAARLATGAAFPFLAENERVLAANLSAPSLVLKLALLAGTHAAKLASIAGLLLAVALVATAARFRPTTRLREAQRWLALLTLGALVSPFAPLPYAALAPLWLITLLVPDARGRSAHAALAAGWLGLALMAYALPLRAGPAVVALSLIGQMFAFGIAGWVLWKPGLAPCEHPEHAG